MTVTLVDNASAGLTKMREQITGLSSGQAKQSMDAFQRSQKEMGNQLKELAAVATGGTQAVIGMISKFGALGLVMGAGVNLMKQYSESLAAIGRLSKTLGVPAAEIKNVVDQLKAVGASGEEATELVRGFANALVDLNLRGSATYRNLMQHAGTHGQQMQALIKQVETASGLEEQLNIVLAAGEKVRQAAFDEEIARGISVEAARRDAKAREKEFVAQWGVNLEVAERTHKRFINMTAEQRAEYDKIIAQGEQVDGHLQRDGPHDRRNKAEIVFGVGADNGRGAAIDSARDRRHRQSIRQDEAARF